MRRQEGSEGWRRAQEREWMEGWAAEVMGEMVRRGVGRVVGRSGKRMGETKELRMEVSGVDWEGGGWGKGAYGQFNLDMAARLSTMSFVVGQGRLDGYFDGRCWM